MTLQTTIEEQRQIQEFVDEITRNEPKAYLNGMPVYTADIVPQGEIWGFPKGVFDKIKSITI